MSPPSVSTLRVPTTLPTATATARKPTGRLFPSRVSSGSIVLSLNSSPPPLNSARLSGLASRTPNPRPNAMPERPLEGSVLGRIHGEEESVPALEQDTLVDGSSRFTANTASARVESVLNRLSKWLVAALLGVVILCRHDAEALWAAIGSVLNSGLSIILKRTFNQERPFSASSSDPGMPSSHAQSIFFNVVFAILSMVDWYGWNGVTVTIGGVVLSFGTYLAWLRVSQQFHTVSQVVVGAAFGSIFCALWVWLWKAAVFEAFRSDPWVRILVLGSAASAFSGFLMYMARYWLRDET